MDSRRPTYPLPPAAQPHHPHNPPLHHPPTPVDQRPPHPAYSQPQQPPLAHPPPPQSHPYHHAAVPAGQQHHPGPSLPPIQVSYPGPGAPQTSQSLPSFHHPPPPSSHEPREGSEYHSYNSHHHSRSEHATPAPVNRSFSHDSAHQQRTPTTPAHPGQQYPSVSAPAPDGMQPHPPPHHMEHAHHGYPNGLPHAPPPPAPQYHQEPPHHYTPVMENHHPYGGPPSAGMYPSQNYGPASTNVRVGDMKRKHMRATQACEQCRQRKQKCDEGQPCSFCKENNLTCQYRDTPPAKTDKNMEKLLSYMESLTQSSSTLNSKMDDIDRRVRRIEQANQAHPQTVPPAPTADSDSMDGILTTRTELDDHRTAPHKLILLWPSVWPLLQDAGVNVNNTYVMEAEDRGILRIWTRGEGIDEHDGTQPGGPASPARSEESGEGSNAATPPDGLWGTGFPQTPVSDIRRSEPYTLGGLKPDGSLDLDVSTVNALYDSYMRHMHIMHPFLDKQRLRRLFDHFIKRYCTGHPNLRQKFAVGSGSDSERPLKRQRSNGSGANPMGQDMNGMRRELPERSPGNAIVWLVLALGKICLHKDPLPGPVQDNKLNANAAVSHQMTGPSVTGSSPVTNNIKPSPMSPQSTPTTQPTPTGAEGMVRIESRSRRSSFDGGLQTSAAPRNLDIIPGLAYYAKAAEVLGDQGDGNDLVHAQMFLLAGLYKGQLARVKESMSWLSMAGRAVLNLLDRYKLYNDNYWTAHGDIRKQHEAGRLRIKDKRHNLIVLASWTCLQLESDILAELRLPSSNIKSVENLLLMPHNMPENEQENYEGLEASNEQSEDAHSYNRMLMYYSSQMFLRKRLNQVHQEMYDDQCLNQTLAQVREMLSGHERILGYWRETLPIGLKWDNNDEPPADILDARLRAKYWGARYIVNRPFLDYALHIMPHAKDGRSIESVAVDSQGNPRDRAEIHLFKAIELMGEHEIWEASKRCVDAAMQSTIAFDGVPERLIITNIHGTSHAQFGNMLVLSATHYNKWLKAIVPEDRFHRLLERTIKFLRRHSQISPTCAHDCQILEKITQLLFGVSPDAKHIYKNEGIERIGSGPGGEPTSAHSSFGPTT